MKNAVFWDVASGGSCQNGRFGGMFRHHQEGDKNQRNWSNVSSNQQPKHAELLIAANFPSSPILVTLMM
jgi:hypothetical protein